MEYVKDIQILKRIGCDNKHQYASLSLSDNEDMDISFIDEEINEEIDNTHCDYDFEKVLPSYKGIKNYMHGDIHVYNKDSQFPELIGIYDKTGLYKMESGRSTVGYLGSQGKARGICIPQCKFMNSTVLDMYAEHKVYIVDASFRKSFMELGDSHLNEKDFQSWIFNNDIEKIYGTHLSFDYWCIIGAVYGKALVAWRGIEKKVYDKMPLYMTVTVSEIFEALNPDCKWQDLSSSVKYEWRKKLYVMFHNLNRWGMLYDLPSENDTRKAYCAKSILENSWIKRRAIGSKEEQRCMNEWGEVWEPFGFKVRLRGSFLFDFCWRKNHNSPSLVQLRPYDYNYKMIFDTCRGSWNKCFSILWGAWIVQYRNYWSKRKNTFKTCELKWSRQEMKYGFAGSIFDIKFLSTYEMKTVLDWYTVKKVFEGKIKRPAHIEKCYITKRNELCWELPENLIDESVIVKNINGANLSLKEAKIDVLPKEVQLAQSRMKGINEENKKHEVVLDNNKIESNQCVIYRVYMKNGKYEIDYNNNGRCYSMKNGVQSFSKEDRKRILIDGNKTCELDYSALHPHLLYVLNNVVFKGRDFYDVGRWYKGHLDCKEARKAVKMMFLRMINARNKVTAIYSFKESWNEKHGLSKKSYIPWIYDLYNAIMKKHHLIAHEFCTGRGVYLMNLDGKLIREVCWRLIREKICVLSIHDSIIVDCRYKDKAKKIMEEEYFKMFGNKIGVK